MDKFVLADYIVEPRRKIAKRMIYQDASVIAFVLNIAEGESLPKHTHFDSTVLVQVLDGSGNVNVDEQITTVKKGDLCKIDGPENMSIENTGPDNLVLYVSISPAPPAKEYAVDADI